jgi:AraC family transcriptional regulator
LGNPDQARKFGAGYKNDMNPVGKALWYIESHFAADLTLEDVAAAVGVSRFHLERAFGLATGRPVMRYVRARRLTEAARALSRGAPDILAVALNAGYGSHEAFSRAFREQFDLTPETVRARRSVETLNLMEPVKMNATPLASLDPPRFETTQPLLIAGIVERYKGENVAGIPSQWQRFRPQMEGIPERAGTETYGVCCNSDAAGNFDYVCGVEVRDFSRLPARFARVRIPGQRYAVFLHRDHVSSIRRTWNAILNTWLPASGFKLADGPDFERYGAGFNPDTGAGGAEIWIPLAP